LNKKIIKFYISFFKKTIQYKILRNGIGEEGVAQIAEGLKTLKSLTSLE
jgi:hypothetical protein